MNHNKPDVGVWVIDLEPTDACLERLGDARRIANALETQVGVLLIESRADDAAFISLLVQHGADLVLLANGNRTEQLETATIGYEHTLTPISRVKTTIDALAPYPVQVVFAGGDPASREWAALLAAQNNWLLISPALMVEYRRGRRSTLR